MYGNTTNRNTTIASNNNDNILIKKGQDCIFLSPCLLFFALRINLSFPHQIYKSFRAAVCFQNQNEMLKFCSTEQTDKRNASLVLMSVLSDEWWDQSQCLN